MIRARLSPQQLDPLGGVTAQTFAWVFTIGAFAIAIGLTLVHLGEYHDPQLLVAALAALSAAGIVTILASSPRRAPFRARSAVAVHLLCLLALVLEAAAQWGTNAAARSDWAPLALALFVMVTGCFRPALEVLGMTLVSAAVVAGVVAAGAAASGRPMPLLVYVCLTAGPVLAAGAGAAAFSATLVNRLMRWREGTRGPRSAAAEQMRVRVRDELRAERLAMIESEIGPFLRGLLEAGATDAATAERARRLGDALRRALVEEADGVWLDGLVAELHDPHGLASRMDDVQRAAVEAACAALVAGGTTAGLARTGGRIRLVLRWDRGGRLGPELQAMLRHVFPGARVQPADRLVELEFDG